MKSISNRPRINNIEARNTEKLLRDKMTTVGISPSSLLKNRLSSVEKGNRE